MFPNIHVRCSPHMHVSADVFHRETSRIAVQRANNSATSDQLYCNYRPKRSFGQGNIFTSVCLSTGGGACSKCSGGCLLQIFGGGCLLQMFGGVPAPNFRGGVPAPNFRGGCLLQIFGGGACSKFSGGVPAPNFRGGGPPIFGIRSTFGRYASYWNAFLFYYKLALVQYVWPIIQSRQD